MATTTLDFETQNFANKSFTVIKKKRNSIVVALGYYYIEILGSSIYRPWKGSKNNNQIKSQSQDPEIEVLVKTIFETRVVLGLENNLNYWTLILFAKLVLD
jgi:hypothetical protein